MRLSDGEEIARYRDLQEMIQNSKGYQWFLKHIDFEIKDEQKSFLIIPIDPSCDYKRFEKQVRLNILNEFRSWAEDCIARGRSKEMMENVHRERQAAILNGTGRGLER